MIQSSLTTWCSGTLVVNIMQVQEFLSRRRHLLFLLSIVVCECQCYVSLSATIVLNADFPTQSRALGHLPRAVQRRVVV